MQLKEKPLNQTSEQDEEPNFGSDLGPFDLNLTPPKYFSWFYLY